MKRNNVFKLTSGIAVIATLLFSFYITSCKKQLTNEVKQSIPKHSISKREIVTNPFNVENVKKALTELNRTEELNPKQIYYYYKFDPQKVTGDILKELEKDSTCQILDFPFADASIYNEEFGAKSKENIEALKDGNLYIVFNNNSNVKSIFENGDNINAEKLDELYLPNADDGDLQIQALITSGFSHEPNIASFKLHWPCFFKIPHGRVTFTDQMNGNTIGVPQIQVWALVIGIPVLTLTDDNGYYIHPHAFSVGTFMGTHAKNWRANIKPFNTTGGVLSSIPQLISNFIMGSVATEGWFGSCDMKDDINIHYGSHSQPRLWSQLLYAFKKHYEYTANDGIPHALGLTVYAQWANNSGASSTPMLGHIQANPISLFTSICNIIFGTQLNTTAPNLFNLIAGEMPDMTFKVNSSFSLFYSEDLMETAFHELGHASLFNQVGEIFWTADVIQVFNNFLGWPSTSPYYPYGTGNQISSGIIQVNEAWAEFIGKEYHRRAQPLATTVVWSLYNRETYPAAIEDDKWFANDWINTGIFYDLMDPINEPDDNLQGYSIKNMYNCFSANTNGFCNWKTSFIQHNPSINVNDLDKLMIKQNSWNGNCYKNWIDPIFN